VLCRAALGGILSTPACKIGIVYLMVIPYVLVAAIGYAVYRLYRKEGKIKTYFPINSHFIIYFDEC
jgi:hypothetical protein